MCIWGRGPETSGQLMQYCRYQKCVYGGPGGGPETSGQLMQYCRYQKCVYGGEVLRHLVN